MLQAILKPNLNLASLVSAVPALWSSCDTQLWAIFRRQPNWAASAELPCKHLTTNLSARGGASTLTHCWSGRESPRHLLYLHYYSSFVTLAVEVNLLPVVDVLCRSNMFLFAGSRHYASETTSVGTATSWFCLCQSADPGCFHWQTLLAWSCRNRGILQWYPLGQGQLLRVRPAVSLFCPSLRHPSLLPSSPRWSWLYQSI